MLRTFISHDTSWGHCLINWYLWQRSGEHGPVRNWPCKYISKWVVQSFRNRLSLSQAQFWQCGKLKMRNSSCKGSGMSQIASLGELGMVQWERKKKTQFLSVCVHACEHPCVYAEATGKSLLFRWDSLSLNLHLANTESSSNPPVSVPPPGTGLQVCYSHTPFYMVLGIWIWRNFTWLYN